MKISVLQLSFKKVENFQAESLRGTKRKGEHPGDLLRDTQGKGERDEAKRSWRKRSRGPGSRATTPNLTPSSPQTSEPRPLLYGSLWLSFKPSFKAKFVWLVLQVVIPFRSPSAEYHEGKDATLFSLPHPNPRSCH